MASAYVQTASRDCDFPQPIMDLIWATIGVDHLRVDSGDVRPGFLVFSGLPANQVWVLVFQDQDNKIYRESIPTELYKHES